MLVTMVFYNWLSNFYCESQSHKRLHEGCPYYCSKRTINPRATNKSLNNFHMKQHRRKLIKSFCHPTQYNPGCMYPIT